MSVSNEYLLLSIFMLFLLYKLSQIVYVNQVADLVLEEKIEDSYLQDLRLLEILCVGIRLDHFVDGPFKCMLGQAMYLFSRLAPDDIYQTERDLVVFCFDRLIVQIVEIALEEDFPRQRSSFDTSFVTFFQRLTGLNIGYPTTEKRIHL